MKLIKELKNMANLRKLDVMTRRSNHLMERLCQRGSRSAMPEPPLTLLTPVEQVPEGPRPTSSTRNPGTRTTQRECAQSAAPKSPYIVSTFMTYSKNAKTRALARTLRKVSLSAAQNRHTVMYKPKRVPCRPLKTRK